MDGMTATVVRPGIQATIQDLGRPGFRKSGVAPGGAVDALGLRIANLLIGNEESAAGLEVTLGGLRLRFSDERCVAWCGGAFEVKAGDLTLPAGHACVIAAGEELRFGHAESGFRAWLAISGGVDVPLVLASRATDLRGSFGGFEGRGLRANDRLPFGKHSPRAQALITSLRDTRAANWGSPPEWALPLSSLHGEPVLRVVRGVDWTRFSSTTIADILTQPFTVSPDSDRMGARLDGPALQRSDESADLISEAVTPGTIQVPPGGQPIMLLADCQTIGGYPRLAHVITVDLPLAAQLGPGDHVHFHEVPMTEAHHLLLQREQNVARFRIGLSLHS
jgi:antagonist of KipI